MRELREISTGLASLDEVLSGLRIGDNVVWQVDTVRDYRQFAVCLAESSMLLGKRLVYMRFAGHERLLQENQYSVMYSIDAYGGFESFSTHVHNIVKTEGEGTYYVFDCLSDLQAAWSSDLMIGNFFMITCPYLFELNTIAYFALLRTTVSFSTIANIRETTQVLIDVYNADESYYVHPLKVWDRYSPTMFFPHLKKGEALTPITSSVDAARLITYIQKRGIESTLRNLDLWDRIFLNIEDLKNDKNKELEKETLLQHLCNVMIGRDRRMLRLAMKYLTLQDFTDIKDHMIGTGFIGGKAVGMIIARKILSKNASLDWEKLQEPHDSFYIGSDVFYSYIVQNGWWKLFMEHKTDERYFSAAADLYDKMLGGSFTNLIKEKFQQIIEYYGQSPIIVRSSSLLEDAFGNAFAGKYESYFLVNQGPPAQRFQEFVKAVQKIYASTMNEDALTYRLQRGLDKLDEQMALLVQRVSGSYYKKYHFPFIAGVGLSYNTYVWKNTINPKAGMLRLVFGLGTRAVNRVEGDYPRIVALDQPLLKPQAGIADARKYSQHDIDVLNITDNELQSIPISGMLREEIHVDIGMIARRDREAEEDMSRRGTDEGDMWIIDFDDFLQNTSFAGDMTNILHTIEEAYSYPVDIEFTVNFSTDGSYRINLLQCRPQQTQWLGARVEIPSDVTDDAIFFRTQGNFLGGSISQPVRRVIFVDPEKYSMLPLTQKYDIARIVGKLNKLIKDRQELPTMIIGPGRWGTTTPSLGISVRFSEISNIRVLIEVAIMKEGLMPEFSYGTHFFQDLVETGIFYIALFFGSEGVEFNEQWLGRFQDRFTDILPDEERYRDVIRVYDMDPPLKIVADIVSQKLLCYKDV